MIEFFYPFIELIHKIVSMLRSIAGFFERLPDKRLTFLKEALTIQDFDPPTREILIEEINQTVYRRITRITADKAMREHINFIVNASKGEVRITQFFRARKYLQIQDDELVAITTTKDEKEARSSKRWATLMALGGVISIGLAGFSEATTSQVYGFLSVGSILLLLAFTMATLSFPYHAAKRLQPELERLQK